MAKLNDSVKVDYNFETCEDFYTGTILVKLVRYTKIGNNLTTAEYAIPAKLEWKAFGVGESCEFFLQIPKDEPSLLDKAKETEVGYWLSRGLRFFVSKTQAKPKEYVLDIRSDFSPIKQAEE